MRMRKRFVILRQLSTQEESKKLYNVEYGGLLRESYLITYKLVSIRKAVVEYIPFGKTTVNAYLIITNL